METRTITEKEEGKRVVNADGENIGVVSGVRNGTAYVDPDPDIGDRIKSILGWDSVDRDDYPLDRDDVDAITDDEIRLTREL